MKKTIDDFVNGDGTHDWDAYTKYQVDQGDKCEECHSYILIASEGIPRKCGSCRALTESDESVNHDDKIRCPHCGNIQGLEFEEGEAYTEGDHEVYCDSCEEEFTFTTNVMYNYDSPALIKKGGD